MRVLHLDTGREMRGGQRQALRLIEGLSASGVECALLARGEGPLLAEARKQGLRAAPITWLRLGLWARSYDLVHAHDARSHTLGALLCPPARLIVSRRVAFTPGSAWKYGRAAHFIAVSEHVSSVLASRGVAREKISVVYDGVPLLEAAAGRAVIAPATGGDPRKGAALAAEGARLAGVELRFSEDLERDLRDAALLLYITHSEGLGSAALLAMSAGVPVVASKTGGLVEIVRHGETGLLVGNAADAIAAAILRILEDPDFGRRLGAAGRAAVKERFTIDHMVRRTMEVYRQVLN